MLNIEKQTSPKHTQWSFQNEIMIENLCSTETETAKHGNGNGETTNPKD